MSGAKWIFLEPFYGGSHRHLADGLVARLPVELDLWTLPPRKWKWRMRGAAPFFAERWRREMPRAAGIITTSLLDGAALRGLLPAQARDLPLLVYFHENQLRYPVQVEDKRDYHFGWTNIQTALAADCVLWNSAFNRDSFLQELPDFLKRLPDATLSSAAADIEARSRILPVPLDIAGLRAGGGPAGARSGPCHILWNHRWEHDKGPELFFAALAGLSAAGYRFELSVLGERFSRQPEVFDRGRAELESHILNWGYLESRDKYLKVLRRADFAVSCARHEFQGLAILEAAACGASPLVPDGLVYPEIWPDRCRYAPGRLKSALARRIREPDRWRGEDYGELCLPFDWSALLPRWAALLAEYS